MTGRQAGTDKAGLPGLCRLCKICSIAFLIEVCLRPFVKFTHGQHDGGLMGHTFYNENVMTLLKDVLL